MSKPLRGRIGVLLATALFAVCAWGVGALPAGEGPTASGLSAGGDAARADGGPADPVAKDEAWRAESADGPLDMGVPDPATAPEAIDDEAAVLPAGARYESDVVLVEPAPDATAADVAQALGSGAGIAVSAEEVADGLIQVDLGGQMSVEEALSALGHIGVAASAQPNYEYLLMDEEATSSDEDASVLDVADGEPDTGRGDAPDRAESGQTDADVEADAPAVQTPDGSEPDHSAEADSDAGVDISAGEDIAPTEDAATTDAEPVLEASATSVNDTYVSSQWALASMRVPEAWDLAKANRTVTVATLDLGCDVSHPDLAANIVGAYNAHNAVYGGSTTDVSSVTSSHFGHGTHVAGIIAAVANNNKGVAGVSYNARVMPVKVVDDSGVAHTADLVKAYDYVMDNASAYNVRVVNLSMANKSTGSMDTALTRKIDEAYAKGIVTVAAAGNASSNASVPYDCYPSDYQTVVSVINLKQSDDGVALSNTSNYNAAGEQDKNISAPGVSILSTMPDGDYQTMSGTSMAAPQVSGVLALMFAAKPSLSAEAAVSTLYKTATDIGAKGWDVTYGYGEVNAYEAVRQAKAGSTQATTGTTQTDAERIKGVLKYRSHVQRTGWEATWRTAGQESGTSGKGLRLEGVQIKLDSAPYTGTIEYRTHVQSIGWESTWKSGGTASGTEGKDLRLEAIQIHLTGAMATHYDVWYRVHAQTYGWLGWARNDSPAGTAGLSKRLEAIDIRILPKGSTAPGQVFGAYVSKTGATPSQLSLGHDVAYRTHVQTYSWQGMVYDGQMSGTQGLAKRLEGIEISLPNKAYAGSIEYRTHVQTYGWRDYVADGAMSGTTGEAKRLEAIQIRLTGAMAQHYDVWYRVHAQTFGWMGWTKNDGRAGTAGYAKRLEGIQVVLVPKGAIAPGSTANAFRSK